MCLCLHSHSVCGSGLLLGGAKDQAAAPALRLREGPGQDEGEAGTPDSRKGLTPRACPAPV